MVKNKKLILFLAVPALVLGLSSLIFYTVRAASAPPLREGTYLPGQTLSVWPSWSLLGNALGQALPTDPINQLASAGTCAVTTNRFCVRDNQCPNNEQCVLHDPATGWSVTDRRFSFACNRDSYAYRYIVDSTTGDYIIRARFEDPGLAISPANFNNFVSGFISTSVFKINDDSGICNFDQEISTLQSGVCGDGRLNPDKGEECDPPGRIEYQVGCVGSIKNLSVCSRTCQWTASTTLCSNLSTCGNGRKEPGETCDDGNLNGRYNHCNNTCSGISPLGKCGNGIVEQAYEVCDPGTPGLEKYSLTSKSNSCAWDCQNWGPYCGDRIVQAEHGEQCDGSQVCTINGRQGTKVCDTGCRRENPDTSLTWWSFEKLTDQGNDVFASPEVSSGNNTAYCMRGSCPTLAEGKYDKALVFSSDTVNKRFLTVDNSPALEVDTAVTVEAWIRPTSYNGLYQRVVEKGGPSTAQGYGLEFNVTSAGHGARFNLWNSTQTSVDSTGAIPLNTWTHLVGTFEKNGNTNIVKIYVNGQLENTNTVVSDQPVMAKAEDPIVIGASVTTGGDYANYFFGGIDEVKLYNRALTADEVQNNFNSGWVCQIGLAAPTTTTVPGTCGNNVVDANEACDRGTANNGRVCTPTYGRSCSYCSANCQNTIDVQPTQYCGNGIIESTEKCDMVAGGDIYASATNTNNTTVTSTDSAHNGYRELTCAQEPAAAHTIKKGEKTCGNCTTGVVSNCISCGVDPNGVSITGGLINVLANSTVPPLERDPLFSQVTDNSLRSLVSSSLRLAIGGCYSIGLSPEEIMRPNVCNQSPLSATSPLVGQATKDLHSTNLTSYTLLNPYGPGNALVSSNPSCSSGTDTSKRYLMYINQDWTRPFDFTVVAAPQTWQYDFVLSPIVDNFVRQKDVRLVLSWVGPEEFYGGVLNPFITTTPEITGASYCSTTSTACSNPMQKKYATGVQYYGIANAQWYGIWYHGFNATAGQTNAESFTINTDAMSGNTYSFYVKSPSVSIRQFKNTARLKVEVYLPQTNYYDPGTEFSSSDPLHNPYHFGTPVKTIYFQAAAASDNQNARYWEVLNINKPDNGSQLTVDNILEINSIRTGPANFSYYLGS